MSGTMIALRVAQKELKQLRQQLANADKVIKRLRKQKEFLLYHIKKSDTWLGAVMRDES